MSEDEREGSDVDSMWRMTKQQGQRGLSEDVLSSSSRRALCGCLRAPRRTDRHSIQARRMSACCSHQPGSLRAAPSEKEAELWGR